MRCGVEAYSNRNPERVRIPEGTVEMMAGFSVEAILGALGGTPEPLVDAIKAGKIRGAVGIVGCNNPKVPQDHGHVTLTKRLIENDILVLVTGCSAWPTARPVRWCRKRRKWPGPGSRTKYTRRSVFPRFCTWAPASTTRGSWCWPRRWRTISGSISFSCRWPARPEWYSEKAVSIGAYVVASGIYTVLGVQPAIFGSPRTWCKLLASGLDDVVGAKFAVEADPEKAACLIRRHIEAKRKALGLEFMSPRGYSAQAARVALY